jgi:hypothetical protein
VVEGGRVRCWGWGRNGQLGYGNTESIGDDETPASVPEVPIGGEVVRLSVGTIGSCARRPGRR